MLRLFRLYCVYKLLNFLQSRSFNGEGVGAWRRKRRSVSRQAAGQGGVEWDDEGTRIPHRDRAGHRTARGPSRLPAEMVVRREETGVEFDVFEGRGAVEELAGKLPTRASTGVEVLVGAATKMRCWPGFAGRRRWRGSSRASCSMRRKTDC